MVFICNTNIIVLEGDKVYLTADIMDFWRPVYADTAFVNGKFSNEQYLAFFSQIWTAYKEKTGLTLDEFAAICFHVHYTKRGIEASRTILDEGNEKTEERLQAYYNMSTYYNRIVGNIYTGSLYLSLLSLLERNTDLSAG